MPTTTISDLPAELLIRVTEYLPFDNVKVLSVINSQFHGFLAPRLFKTLRASNREKDACFITQVVEKFGRHVQTLVFDCYLHPDKGHDDESDPEPWSDENEFDDDDQDGDADDYAPQRLDGIVDSSGKGQRKPVVVVEDDSDKDMKGTDEIKNDELEAVHVDAASQNSHKSHRGSDVAGREVRKKQSPWVQPGFSQIAQDLLSGKHLSGLKSLAITFHPLDNFNTTEGDWGGALEIGDGHSIYIHERLETEEERTEQEMTYTWRADLNLAFGSLFRNTSIGKLAIHNLLPKVVSTFYEPDWPLFLAKLSEVEINLWGGENGAGWQSNTLEGYLDFIACQHEVIFQHLRSAKRVLFASEEYSPVGCTGMNHTPIPIHGVDIPDIRDLTVKNCYIDPALQSFVRSKAAQLESLRLVDCSSAATEYALAQNVITWAAFFHNVRSSYPILKHLEVSNKNIDLVGYVTRDSEEAARKEEAEILEEVKRSEGKRKLFAYSQLDDKYGFMVQMEEENVRRFKSGADQTAYDALMELVEKNGKVGKAAA